MRRKMPTRPSRRRVTSKKGIEQVEEKIAKALREGEFYQVSQMVRMVAER
jgi:hypothetical protein|tara:strand:+ start:2114 stop:2263 length:150 start_codon:yes stop_codon:yes gene_type:complete